MPSLATRCIHSDHKAPSTAAGSDVAVFGQDFELGDASRVKGDGAKIGAVDHVQTQTTIRLRQHTINGDVTQFARQPHLLALLDVHW